MRFFSNRLQTDADGIIPDRRHGFASFDAVLSYHIRNEQSRFNLHELDCS